MSLELLTALAFVIGVGGLVASIVGVVTCARRNAPQPPDDTPGAPKPPRTLAFGWDVCWSLRIWYALLTASVVLIILGFAGLVSVIGQDETNIFVTDPDAGDVVEMVTLVRGTSVHVADERAIWVIVKLHGEARYYPQPQVTVIDLEGEDEWSVQALIGGPDGVGKAYDILAVVAGPDANDTFLEHVADVETATLGAPLDRLPQDVTIYENVTVFRE